MYTGDGQVSGETVCGFHTTQLCLVAELDIVFHRYLKIESLGSFIIKSYGTVEIPRDVHESHLLFQLKFPKNVIVLILLPISI